ncbi:hypothetical protein WJX84_002747 [Apatococcus fuscideae]|uniref:Ketosynthase family 3 (KS3) domain-containing protein n=1 Tax=Apatococcus fuscideae TaxID=2026836 RepID=A0AAW1SD35_9CHLO
MHLVEFASSVVCVAGEFEPYGFLENMYTAEDLCTPVPQERWDVESLYAETDVLRSNMLRAAYFLHRVDRFDDGAFRQSKSEAVAMDPQTRILLEQSFATLQGMKGTVAGASQASTGVYVGCVWQEYALFLEHHTVKPTVSILTGSGFNFMIGRVSYTFGLQGPCIGMDTACSSSLVAAHLASTGLVNGESSSALAAGINLMLVPDTTINLARLGALSADGHSKTFDASANGYARGEGCIVYGFARTSDTLQSGHQPEAVMLGSAYNQAGRSSGLTAPNGPAQTALVRTALGAAALQPQDLSFVSMHGTGTPLGDPIEVGALGQALAGTQDRPSHATLGSVKACYGHSEGSAGAHGALLALSVLQQQAAAPTMHLRNLNPYVEAAFADTKRACNASTMPPRDPDATSGPKSGLFVGSHGGGAVNYAWGRHG